MPYKEYAEIPLLIKEYVLTVSNGKRIEDIPLDEINGFLAGLEQHYSKRPEEVTLG
jgi:hypothetical protein